MGKTKSALKEQPARLARSKRSSKLGRKQRTHRAGQQQNSSKPDRRQRTPRAGQQQRSQTSQPRNLSKPDRRQEKLTYHDFYHKYLDNKLRLKTYQKVGIILLVVVASGFVGWLWEFLLAEIEGSFKHLYIKGGNLLPWMNIYAYGAIVIVLVAHRLKKYPWAVFVVSALATGLLELFAGWVVYEVGHGTRYWDYRTSWWGWGNIDGFVCPASATVFGLAALALIYWLLPRIVYLSFKMKRRAFLTLAITLFTVVMVDDITNLTLKNLNLPTAQNLYEALGWRFKS